MVANRGYIKYSGYTTNCLYPLYFLFIITMGLLFPACGKKSPPTIKIYEKPESVKNLRVVHNESGLVLSWSYPEESKVPVKGFIILRSEKEAFEKVGYLETDGKKVLSFIDRDIRTDRTYSYRVIAESIKGLLSNPVEAKATPTKLPDPPKDIRFVIKNDSIELLWDNKGACYNIYRSIDAGSFLLLNRMPFCANSFTDGPFPDLSVHYIIRSVITTDIINEGKASQEIVIGPQDFVPSPPSDIRFALGKDRIFLLWKESPEIWVRGYRVYRKAEGEGDFRNIGESVIPSLVDTALQGLHGKRISYMIRALGPLKESKPAYVQCVYTYPD